MGLVHDAREAMEGPQPGRGAAVRAVERAFFGALLLDCRLIHVAQLDGLKPEHFTSAGHRTIYRAMLSRVAQKRAFDLPVLAADLEADGKLDDVGGATYLAMCLENTDVEMVGEYVALIQQAALERRIAGDKGVER